MKARETSGGKSDWRFLKLGADLLKGEAESPCGDIAQDTVGESEARWTG